MECPKCHSDDLTRSRRRLVERLILPLVRAQVTGAGIVKTDFGWACSGAS